MTVTQVYVEVSEKRSVNFQSCGICVGLSARLDPGDDEETVRLTLEEKCRKAIDQAYARHYLRRAEERE